jgi:dienelactone hydrolase
MKTRAQLRNFLKVKIHNEHIGYELISKVEFKEYERQLISYKGNEKDEIRAYLFIPKINKIRGAILVHHQHNGERQFGKSEVSGIIGDKYQYFCQELSRRGIITLAPDSICFEDRRINKKGIEPDTEDEDFLQHFNEMCYRLLRNETLMKKVIEDSSIAISLLKYHKSFNIKKVGILGHSYGGNTVIFHSALDKRIKISCSSGAVCSYKTKIENNTGIEMAEVIPGFLNKFEIKDLLNCICPRELSIISGSEDIYSQDAKELYNKLKKKYRKKGKESRLELKHYVGGHKLDETRFRDIINWFDEKF